MQQSHTWYLASNYRDQKTKEIITLYGCRSIIEPYFRDVKDKRFGFRLANTHINSPERRDKLFLIVAIAYVLFTLLGAAREQLGFDVKLYVNIVKKRTHFLIRQGMFYYDFFRHFSDKEKNELMSVFNALLESHSLWSEILCIV